MKKIESGNAVCMFQIQCFESNILISFTKGSRLARKKGKNRILDEVTPVAKCECIPWTNWMRLHQHG